MSVFHVAAGSVAVIAGLLFASVLIAAQAEVPQPTAQMNRVLYDKPVVETDRYVPRHTARQVTRLVAPHAQMNRASYVRITRDE